MILASFSVMLHFRTLPYTWYLVTQATRDYCACCNLLAVRVAKNFLALQSRLEKLTLAVRKTIASLGIMGDQLRATLKPVNTIVLWCLGAFKRGLNGSPMMLREMLDLPDSYTSDRCCFSRFCFDPRPVDRKTGAKNREGGYKVWHPSLVWKGLQAPFH